MKIYNNLLFTLSAVLCFIIMIGCEDKIEYQDSKEPQSITILKITDNTVPVYTTESFQIELAILPENAEIETPPLFEYMSGDKGVFTVSDKGLITGMSVGEAVLYINSSNYPALTCKAIVNVTDRTYDITELELDEKFKNLTIATGTIINLSNSISIKPENATNKQLSYSSSDTNIVTVNKEGVIEALKIGNATIKISATDGSSKFAECKITVKDPIYTLLDRNGWLVTPSHKLPIDAAISNAPESLIDGDPKTCISMVKPGKSYGGISVTADEEVSFIIDMQKEVDFDFLDIQHRTSNSNQYLRPHGFNIYGSNNGQDFNMIAENLPGQPALSQYKLNLPSSVKYRYVKVIYSSWDTKSGSTIQLAELGIGTKHFE